MVDLAAVAVRQEYQQVAELLHLVKAVMAVAMVQLAHLSQQVAVAVREQ
jgi:hypothetical protein